MLIDWLSSKDGARAASPSSPLTRWVGGSPPSSGGEDGGDGRGFEYRLPRVLTMLEVVVWGNSGDDYCRKWGIVVVLLWAGSWIFEQSCSGFLVAGCEQD